MYRATTAEILRFVNVGRYIVCKVATALGENPQRPFHNDDRLRLNADSHPRSEEFH